MKNFKSLSFSSLIIVIVLFIASCSPKTKTITIDNSTGLILNGGTSIRAVKNGQPGQNEFYEVKYTLMYDIEVSMNGTDFGLIEGGSKSEAKQVKDANNVKFDKLKILTNEDGKYVYYKDYYTQEKVYVDFTEEKLKKCKDFNKCITNIGSIESELKKLETAGPLLNTTWTWNVSYGVNGDKIRIQQEKDKKNKKRR